MFDSYRLGTRSPDVHITNRIEHKPHDSADAARLHGELKQPAEQEVAQAVIERFGAHNELTAVVAHHQMDYATHEHRVRLMFKLNGTAHTIIVTKDAYTNKSSLHREIAEAILGELVKRLNVRLLPDGGR